MSNTSQPLTPKPDRPIEPIEMLFAHLKRILKLIESVFSGMARAIIHNSDYESTKAAMDAIDRHFMERNQHFLDNPKRAGNKIWGKGRTSSEFAASNNCKDPAYR